MSTQLYDCFVELNFQLVLHKHGIERVLTITRLMFNLSFASYTSLLVSLLIRYLPDWLLRDDLSNSAHLDTAH